MKCLSEEETYIPVEVFISYVLYFNTCDRFEVEVIGVYNGDGRG